MTFIDFSARGRLYYLLGSKDKILLKSEYFP